MSNPDDLKKQSKEYSNETLAAHVVVWRLLGVNKEFAIASMEELVRRKVEEQSPFDYEKWIQEELDKSPKPNDETPQLGNLLQNLFKSNFKG